jgi:hypothetical protein
MDLINKNILIISPQDWGTMKISKHHYSTELAKKGNKVYFLNPPQVHSFFKKAKITCDFNTGHKNLTIISHNLGFSKYFYFHSPCLYNYFISRHINKLLKHINCPIDIVWSFDIGNLYPLRYFNNVKLRIFHPVDEPLNQNAIKAAEDADILFTTTKEIQNIYAHFDIPRHVINHGVSEIFFKHALQTTHQKKICVGYSGNLTRPDIDRTTLLSIIQNYPVIDFHFWGAYDLVKSNISGSDDADTRSFIKKLKEFNNVKLYGAVTAEELIKGYNEIDLFLICYDIQKHQSKGNNYHKTMEFLSTGKAIVSNNITAYQETKDLVYMCPERDSNKSLPFVFESAISTLKYINSEELQNKRRAFAYDNRYSRQVERIETILQSISSD